ncbi:hypothetical protein CLF_100408 [Clonorchis sinensis]|uniref:Uncharacterized protein n=1 Tax=Clonorchis sinensis TaxID=79923 RepID=G7Y3D6_CLOSI|nr:hypothetical protein CLF_100408 [Clonorchis sinensis]
MTTRQLFRPYFIRICLRSQAASDSRNFLHNRSICGFKRVSIGPVGLDWIVRVWTSCLDINRTSVHSRIPNQLRWSLPSSWATSRVRDIVRHGPVAPSMALKHPSYGLQCIVPFPIPPLNRPLTASILASLHQTGVALDLSFTLIRAHHQFISLAVSEFELPTSGMRGKHHSNNAHWTHQSTDTTRTVMGHRSTPRANQSHRSSVNTFTSSDVIFQRCLGKCCIRSLRKRTVTACLWTPRSWCTELSELSSLQMHGPHAEVTSELSSTFTLTACVRYLRTTKQIDSTTQKPSNERRSSWHEHFLKICSDLLTDEGLAEIRKGKEEIRLKISQCESVGYDITQLNVLHKGCFMFHLVRYSRYRSILFEGALSTRLLLMDFQQPYGERAVENDQNTSSLHAVIVGYPEVGSCCNMYMTNRKKKNATTHHNIFETREVNFSCTAETPDEKLCNGTQEDPITLPRKIIAVFAKYSHFHTNWIFTADSNENEVYTGCRGLRWMHTRLNADRICCVRTSPHCDVIGESGNLCQPAACQQQAHDRGKEFEYGVRISVLNYMEGLHYATHVFRLCNSDSGSFPELPYQLTEYTVALITLVLNVATSRKVCPGDGSITYRYAILLRLQRQTLYHLRMAVHAS